jgi:hypothetical protein
MARVRAFKSSLPKATDFVEKAKAVGLAELVSLRSSAAHFQPATGSDASALRRPESDRAVAIKGEERRVLMELSEALREAGANKKAEQQDTRAPLRRSQVRKSSRAADVIKMMTEIARRTKVSVAYPLEDIAANDAGTAGRASDRGTKYSESFVGRSDWTTDRPNHSAKTLSFTSVMSWTGSSALPQAKPEAMGVLLTAHQQMTSRRQARAGSRRPKRSAVPAIVLTKRSAHWNLAERSRSTQNSPRIVWPLEF